MVDDPALFGAIAAANALNDVFAMGGRPLVALSVAAFPEELPVEIVRAIFDAAAAKVHEAGAVLAGGHTIRDPEAEVRARGGRDRSPRCALAEELGAAGRRRLPDEAARYRPRARGRGQGPARGGGDGRGHAPHDRAERPGRRGVARLRAPAVTDVTGFGLFGHVHEVAERSGVCIEPTPARFRPFPALWPRRHRASGRVATRATGTSLPPPSSWTGRQ